MSEKLMSVDTVNGVTCVAFLKSNLVDGPQIAQIGHDLSDLVRDTPDPRILLNFKGVEHLSSAAMSTLIRVHKAVVERKGQLRLANVNENIQEPLRITNLDQIFKVDGTARESLGKFTQPDAESAEA